MKRDRLAEIVAWRQREAPDAVFDQSIAAGMIALAGNGPVRAEHVTQAIEYAHSAGLTNLDELHAVGALLLRFEVAHGAAPEELPPLPRTQTNDGIAMIELPDEPAPAPEPAPEPAPMQAASPPETPSPVSSQLPTITIKSPRPHLAEPSTSREAAPLPTVDEPTTPPKRSRAGLMIAVALIVGGGAFALRSRPSPVTPAPPTSRPAQAPTVKPPAAPLGNAVRLTGFDLRTPAGWSAAADLLYRGPADDPDETMYFVTTPLPAELAAPSAPDAALVAVTRVAARGIGGRLAREGADFDLASCGIAGKRRPDAPRTGACHGLAQTAAGPLQIDAYLRPSGDRAILAIVTARKPRPGARDEAVDILASAVPRL